jgi:hypothetical protein
MTRAKDDQAMKSAFLMVAEEQRKWKPAESTAIGLFRQQG